MSKKSEPVITITTDELPDAWSRASIADLAVSDGVFVDGDWVESKDQDPNWLKDESLEPSDKPPEPGLIAAEIVEVLEAALEQFRETAADLGEPEDISA